MKFIISHIIYLNFLVLSAKFYQSQCPHCSIFNLRKSLKNFCAYDMCLI